MRRCSCSCLALTFAFVCGAAPQDQSPRFEVASVKPVGRDVRMGFSEDAGQISWARIDLANMIGSAYGVRPDQITGPDWLKTEFYAITAKLPPGATREQYPQMIANLLADRFGLVVHRITKDVPGYELVVAAGGPKNLTPANPEAAKDAPSADVGRGGFKPDANGFPVTPPGMTYAGQRDNDMLKMTFRQDAMAFLAAQLRSTLSQIGSRETVPVTDRTGITGKFDFHLAIPAPPMWLPPELRAQTPELGPRDISAALEKQLGLKLNAVKAKLDFIVVDRINKVPTDD